MATTRLHINGVMGVPYSFVAKPAAGAPVISLIDVNIAGTWKKATMHANIAGVWKDIHSIFVKVGATWKEL